MWDAGLYDGRHAFVWENGRDLVDLLAPRPGERILDLGCGTGHLTARIARAGALVEGLDASEDMIAAARRAYPQVPFRVGDARRLDAGGPYDAVFANAVLHWIPEADRVAGEVARVLRPGGRFVAELGGQGNVAALRKGLDEAARGLGLAPADPPWYFPSLAAYVGVLDRAGLDVTLAVLFDRPTPLEGDEGLRDWVRMFGRHVLAGVPPDRHAEFLAGAEARLRPLLYRDGHWVADYRRLRVVAHKPDAPAA